MYIVECLLLLVSRKIHLVYIISTSTLLFCRLKQRPVGGMCAIVGAVVNTVLNSELLQLLNSLVQLKKQPLQSGDAVLKFYRATVRLFFSQQCTPV